MPERLLEIDNLTVHFPGTPAAAVQGISLHVDVGETLGLVGESGSGKSLTALALAGLLPAAAQAHWTQFVLTGQSIQAMAGVRPGLAIIFQDPLNALHPVLRCGHQVAEAVAQRHPTDRTHHKARTLALLEQVGLPEPLRIARAYPHELSGGQQQRVMIAMALALEPRLLIADEPTTALDAAVQQGILDLLADLKATRNLALLLISHDLGVVSALADRVAVMQQGRIVETGPAAELLEKPQHPYTRGLIACRPSLEQQYQRLPTLCDFEKTPDFSPVERSPAEIAARKSALYAQPPLLRAENLTVRYPLRKNWLTGPSGWIDAVQAISFDLFPGETLGIVGESGSGKTSLGKALLNITFAAQSSRPAAVLIPQNPYAALNPRHRVGECLEEPLRVHRLVPNRAEAQQRALELLRLVGLDEELYRRYPDELSGGQRQRVCIARALTLSPQLLICDEITSALDVSVQATVLNLLLDLQAQLGLTYVLISHDLRVVKQMCDRILVMHEGKGVF